MRKLTIWLLLFCPLTVMADTLTFNLSYTGTRVSGVPLPPDEIAFIHMHCDPGQAATYSHPVENGVLPPTVMFPVEPGTYSCAARIETTDGLQSLKSMMVTRDSVPDEPGPPDPAEPPILSD